MKKFSLYLLALVAITQTSQATSTYGKNFFQQRSQGSNYAREMVGVTHFTAPCDSDCLNGFLAITPEYTRSFDRDEIGKYFFFNGTNTMTFGAAGGEGVDVFARNFFLNDNFQGSVTALPRVSNFLVDFRFRLNLDEWYCGLYFDLYAPIVWTKWDMNLREEVVSTGTFIQQFALGNTGANDRAPNNSIIQAFKGQNLNTAVFPNLLQPLNYGKIDGAQTKAGLADLTVALGYNFICDECKHVGVDIRAIFPTGNRPDAEFLFEPIVGNGKHFELGAGVSAHYEIWNNCCDSSFSIWAVGQFYHMFKARQRRIFDLVETGTLTGISAGCGQPVQNIGSNRLLIKKFSGGPSNPQLTEILYGPNVLARKLKVRNDLHTEVVLLLDYQRCGFTVDFGYNFWGRTKDKVSEVEAIEPNTYGLQGKTLGSNEPAPATTNSTGSTARINGTLGNPDLANIYISTDDLSICSVEHPTAFSHKVFAHIGYAWCKCDYTPFLGIGGEVEFSGKENNALDQWGFWIKGGFAFS